MALFVGCTKHSTNIKNYDFRSLTKRIICSSVVIIPVICIALPLVQVRKLRSPVVE